MVDTPDLLDAQGLTYLPQTTGLAEGTNLVLAPQRSQDRLAHLPDDLYDLSAESHLSRLIKPLLGDTGMGRLQQAGTLARLQHSLAGTRFFDLDHFYGALFGLQRRRDEVLDVDPYRDVLTDDQWSEVAIKDDSYRSRISQFAQAIGYGATPTGMELMAEALLNCDVDIYENFVLSDRATKSWGDVESLGTWGDLESYRWDGLESATDPSVLGTFDRSVFVVVPKRDITEEERYDVVRVLSRLKPANSVLRVNPLGQPNLVNVPIRHVSSDSEELANHTANHRG